MIPGFFGEKCRTPDPIFPVTNEFVNFHSGGLSSRDVDIECIFEGNLMITVTFVYEPNYLPFTYFRRPALSGDGRNDDRPYHIQD
jgi:hypothetical protein